MDQIKNLLENLKFLKTEFFTAESLEKSYEHALQNWVSEQDMDRAFNYYIQRLFPIKCEMIREQRNHLEPLSLLFVPVGTQPFAPVLAILGNPSSRIALLESSDPLSIHSGEIIENSIGSQESKAVIHLRIKETDVVDIARAMKAVYDSLGLPDGRLVGADITGGRKPMSLAIGAIGSLYGWRIFYVEGQFLRGRMALSINENVIELGNVLEVFGYSRREQGYLLNRTGAFKEASKIFEELSHESLASKKDRILQYKSLAKHHIINVSPELAARGLRSLINLVDEENALIIKEAVKLMKKASDFKNNKTVSQENEEAWIQCLLIGAKLRAGISDIYGAASMLLDIHRILGDESHSKEIFSRTKITSELKYVEEKLKIQNGYGIFKNLLAFLEKD